MASLNVTGMDELIARIDELAGAADPALRAAVRAGAEVALKSMTAAIPVSARHAQHLRDHVRIMREGHDAVDGYYCDIYPDGTRPGGGKASARRYATIGYVLEYGNSSMAPRPWMRTGLKAAEGEVRAAMLEALARQLGGDA